MTYTYVHKLCIDDPNWLNSLFSVYFRLVLILGGMVNYLAALMTNKQNLESYLEYLSGAKNILNQNWIRIKNLS